MNYDFHGFYRGPYECSCLASGMGENTVVEKLYILSRQRNIL